MIPRTDTPAASSAFARVARSGLGHMTCAEFGERWNTGKGRHAYLLLFLRDPSDEKQLFTLLSRINTDVALAAIKTTTLLPASLLRKTTEQNNDWAKRIIETACKDMSFAMDLARTLATRCRCEDIAYSSFDTEIVQFVQSQTS